MNFCTLATDVYLVQGSARAAIYDLKNGQLFSISKKIKDLLDRTSEYPLNEVARNQEEENILATFLNHELLIKTTERQKLKDIRELGKPFMHHFAWIEVTRQCNLSCTFCYESSNPSCLEKMTFDDFKLIVENLKEYGIQKIQFIGGEPMILKNLLKEMILYARPYFDFIEVYTNGIAINDEWCAFFKEHSINIAISIHSYLPEEHDRVTQVKGSHKRVERAERLLKKYNITYRIGTVESKACKVGAPNETTPYRLNPKMPKISGRADILSYDFEMFKKKAIKKESKMHPINKDFIVRSVSGHQCFNKNIYISTTLDVYPCVMERRKTHGKISEKKLSHILDASLVQLSKDFIEGCKNCEYRYGCFDCRPDSNGNDFLKKPWYCSYDPTTGQWHDLEKMFNNLTLKAKSVSYDTPIKIRVEQG